MGLLIYLISLVDRIICLLTIYSMITGIALCTLIPIAWYYSTAVCPWRKDGDYYTPWQNIKLYFAGWSKSFKKFGISVIITICLAALIPSSKTIAAIYLIPKLAKSDSAATLSRIPNKALQVFESKLDEYIDGFKVSTNK